MAAKKQIALVVDDEAVFLEITSMKLEAVGFVVHTATTVPEAFAKAREIIPRIVVSDIHIVPGPNGWELGLELRQDEVTRDIPFVLFTSLQNPWAEFPGGRERAEQLLRPVAVLSKVTDMETLGEKVLKFIS